MASSSFIELRMSNPPIFHSPLSVVYMEEARILPWTDVASSLMNFNVFATLCRPHFSDSSDSAFRLVDQVRGAILSVAI